MRQIFRLGILTVLMPLLAATQARADNAVPETRPLAPNRAKLLFRMIDADGNIRPGGHVARMRWVWTKATPTDLVPSPALRIWLETDLPRDWEVRKITGNAVTVAEPFQPGLTQTIALDLRAREGRLRLEFTDAAGVPREMTLAVEMTLLRPYILVDPSCDKADVKMLVNADDARSLYVGLSCEFLGDSYDLYFFRSQGARWAKGNGLVTFDSQNRFMSFLFHFKKPDRKMRRADGLFRVGVADEQGRVSDYTIYYQPDLSLPRFFARVGLAPAFYRYDDNLHAVTLRQLTLDARAGAGVRLLDEQLDATFDASGNIYAPWNDPTEVPEARFYTGDGRINWHIPYRVEYTPNDFALSLGWYYWGMTVSGADYGIRGLHGPQAQLTFTHAENGHAGWWLWAKYATIADHFAFIEPENRQWGTGGGLELGAHEKKPFALTLDFSSFRSELEDHSNAMHGYSGALGVQKPF